VAASRPHRTSRRRKRFYWTAGSLLIGTAIAVALALAITRNGSERSYVPGERVEGITASLEQKLPAGAPRLRFSDATAEAGLGGFRTFLGDRTSQLPEDMGSGAAWGDYDGDGDDDLFVVAAGGPLTAKPEERAASVLYENLGDGTFRPVDSFPETRIVGMGAAWADYDGDGRLDLAVSGFNALRLFHNEGGGFRRVETFPEPEGFWAGLAWGDYDQDGDLDLYVCGYVRYRSEQADRAKVSLQYGRAVPFTLNPASYPPERNLLFRNEGGGRFVEVAHELGVDNVEGRSLQAVWHDFDEDGRLDLYVANDISDNAFYHNRGGRFVEIAHEAWVADYRGAMGLAVGDWNRDGDDDLFITHWIAQENALYDSLRFGSRRSAPQPGGTAPAPLRFVDVADQVGLGQIALRMVGWGASFADFDADGWLDLAVANGSTFETEESPKRLVGQPDFLFWNEAGRSFHDLAPLIEPLAAVHVTRGLAVSDYDLDGDVDLLLVDHQEGVRLLRNDTKGGNSVELRLRERRGSGFGFGDGARVAVRVGGEVLRRSAGGVSYLSQDTRLVHVGLGSAREVEQVEVIWPGGRRQLFGRLSAGRIWELSEGVAEPRTLAPRKGEAPLPDPAPAGEAGRKRVLEFWEQFRAGMDALKREGDCARAISHFRRALELDPNHEDSRYYLANCLFESGDRDGAIEELETLLEINPMSHRGCRRLACILAEPGASAASLERAEAEIQRAIALNPEETGGLLAGAEIALLRGDRAAARERLDHVLRSNPGSVPALYLRGFLDLEEGREPEARAKLERAARARQAEAKKRGASEEGEVRKRMHREATPLTPVWEDWDGSTDTRQAYRRLEEVLGRQGRARGSGR